MKPNRNVQNKPVVKEQKKVTGSAARDDGVEAPKKPTAEPTIIAVATPEVPKKT